MTFAQTGTISSPFTSLAQAMNVSSAGIYYFNIGTKSFSTQVNAYGWVLVATDIGGSSASNLNQITALTPTTRGILTPSILSSLIPITAVGISSSDGVINVTTTNLIIALRVNANITINQGLTDNLLFGSPWTGSGASNLNSQASYCSDITTLDAVVAHPCGDGSKFHWLPNTGQLAEVWSSGFISNTVTFNLWVQSSPILTPLPIELLNFNAVYNKSTSHVDINWETSTETNNNYFTVEKSIDGENFTGIENVNSTATNGNSFSALSYKISDANPSAGASYYRLKQTDFNGNYKYFKIVEVNSNINQGVFIYPNPISDKDNLSVNVIGYNNQNITIKISDLIGNEIFSEDFAVHENNRAFMINEFKNFVPGSYLISVICPNKVSCFQVINK